MEAQSIVCESHEVKVNDEQCEQEEIKMTPWEVKGKINYMDQIHKFGTNPIDGKLIERWERVTKMKAHHFLRRGLVFSHQDIEKILDCVEQGIPVYIYTGRGPSSESMHLGHMVPFLFTKYLQDALNCIVVIQMSDDEKFFFKSRDGGGGPMDLEKFRQLSYKNARDIIACGFNPDKTLIFSNMESNKDHLYLNNVLIMNATTTNQVKSTYGLGETVDQHVRELVSRELEVESKLPNPDPDKIRSYEKLLKNNDIKKESSDNLGQCVWPAFQCGPAFCSSFTTLFSNAILKALREKGESMPPNVVKNMKKILGEFKDLKKSKNMMCLVPMAIDQAPYFRMARDVAQTLCHQKPAVIHSEFLPGLKQSNGKMNSTGDSKNSTLFLDCDPQKIAKIIKKHAFSGGGNNEELHLKYGGNIRVDICYQYLTYFLDDDAMLKHIAIEYSSGRMMSEELKTRTAELISQFIENHQKNKNALTEQDVMMFFDANRVLDIGGCYDRPELDCSESVDYSIQGIDFDRTFGCKQNNPDDCFANNQDHKSNVISDVISDVSSDAIGDATDDVMSDVIAELVKSEANI